MGINGRFAISSLSDHANWSILLERIMHRRLVSPADEILHHPTYNCRPPNTR